MFNSADGYDFQFLKKNSTMNVVRAKPNIHVIVSRRHDYRTKIQTC